MGHLLFIFLTILYTLTYVCRPAGWDNMKKISILHENLQSMKASDYYRDVIAQPPTNRKVRAYLASAIDTVLTQCEYIGKKSY